MQGKDFAMLVSVAEASYAQGLAGMKVCVAPADIPHRKQTGRDAEYVR